MALSCRHKTARQLLAARLVVPQPFWGAFALVRLPPLDTKPVSLSLTGCPTGVRRDTSPIAVDVLDMTVRLSSGDDGGR